MLVRHLLQLMPLSSRLTADLTSKMLLLKFLKMVSMSTVYSFRALNGMLQDHALRIVIPENQSSNSLLFGSNQLIQTIPSSKDVMNVHFTRHLTDKVLCLPQVTPPTSSSSCIFQVKCQKIIGSEEVSHFSA